MISVYSSILESNQITIYIHSKKKIRIYISFCFPQYKYNFFFLHMDPHGLTKKSLFLFVSYIAGQTFGGFKKGFGLRPVALATGQKPCPLKNAKELDKCAECNNALVCHQ